MNHPSTAQARPPSPLSVFCSKGNDYRQFKSATDRIADDVYQSLTDIGVFDVMTQEVSYLLTHQPDFPAGFRFEEMDIDNGKVIVYVNIFHASLEQSIAAGQGTTVEKRLPLLPFKKRPEDPPPFPHIQIETTSKAWLLQD